MVFDDVVLYNCQRLESVYVCRNYNVLSFVSTGEVEELERLTVQIGTKSIEVEVADELHERQRGLMHRKEMDTDHGMLFVYPTAGTSFFLDEEYSYPFEHCVHWIRLSDCTHRKYGST